MVKSIVFLGKVFIQPKLREDVLFLKLQLNVICQVVKIEQNINH